LLLEGQGPVLSILLSLQTWIVLVVESDHHVLEPCPETTNYLDPFYIKYCS
jgi:hypothetical protein